MKLDYKRIGDYIREVDERNSDLSITKLIGVSMEKTFISSVANIVGTDMSVYKKLNKGQFACKLMSVGRDEKLPVDLYKEDEPAIVSSAYYVFEPIDENVLLQDYLFMWLCRPENDRYIGFISGGDVRGGISWETFCEIPIKIPPITKQKEIVQEYNAVMNRINLNNEFIQKLEETGRTIYKQWFIDFEFPDENGKPYKSSGGEMVEIEFQDVPKGWRIGTLKEIAFLSNKKTSVDKLTLKNYVSTENMLQNRGGITEISDLPEVEKVQMFDTGDILISNIRPYLKKIWLATFEGGCSNDVLCFKVKERLYPEYLYYILERDMFFDYVMAGSNGAKMPRGDKDWIMLFPIVLPKEQVFEKFRQIFIPIMELRNCKIQEIASLNQISKILLSKLVTIEN